MDTEESTQVENSAQVDQIRPGLNYLRSAWTSELYYNKIYALYDSDNESTDDTTDLFKIQLPSFHIHDQDEEDNDEVNNEIFRMISVGNILCLIGSVCGTVFVFTTSNLTLSALLHKKAWMVHTILPLCIVWWSIMILVLKNTTENIRLYLNWTQASAIIMVATNFAISKYALLPEQQKQEQQLLLFHILFGSLAMVAFGLFSFAQRLHHSNQLKTHRLKLKILTETNKIQDYVDEITQGYTTQRLAFLNTVSQEVQDVALMVITTLEQFSPSHILSSTHELLSACSIAVPIASISAINTTIRQVCHISSHLKLLSLLTVQSWLQSNRDKPNHIEQSNNITLPSLIVVEFDIGELLQNVGDALAGVAAKLDVNLVIYHYDNTLNHTIVIGDEGAIRHVLLNYIRNILECCTAESCIEVGLQVTTHEDNVDITFYITHTLPDCHNAGSALLPNANLTAQLLAYIQATSTVDIGKNQTRFEFTFQLESGADINQNESRIISNASDSFMHHYANVKFSNEPSLNDLTLFIENLNGLKMVLYAPEQSIFAKHLTSCLTSWNADISHVPISPPTLSESEEETDTMKQHPNRTDLLNRQANPPIPSPAIEEQHIHSIPPAFILIDDDISTLEKKINEFRAQPPASANVLQAHHGGRRQHPKHQKSSHLHQNFFHQGTTAIIHFTSLTKYRAVRDIIQLFASLPTRDPFSMPRIVVVPKPAGPRRFLTALHTAWNNSVVEPHFSAIATSPSSPRPPAVSTLFQREHTHLSGMNQAYSPSSSSASSSHPPPERTSPNEQQISPGHGRKPMGGLFSPTGEGTYFNQHTSPATNDSTVPRRKSSSEGQSVDYLTAKTALSSSEIPSLMNTLPDTLTFETHSTSDEPISTSSPIVAVGNTVSETTDSASAANAGMADTDKKSRVMSRSMSNFKLHKKKRKDRGTPFANVISPPINVLIVEDNIINQAILSTWMKKHNIKYSVASNGQEAVEKWKNGGFHLVLMDIQLPVMNGIDATKMIRSIEKERKIGVLPMSSSFLRQQQAVAAAAAATVVHDTTPTYEIEMVSDMLLAEEDKDDTPSIFRSPVIIVALTASSLESDRHAALAAGCNDFLTKPVSLEWLEKKIIEWGCMQALIDFEGWRRWKKSSAADQNKGGKVSTASNILSTLTSPSLDNVTREKKEVETKRIEDLSRSNSRDGIILPGVCSLIKSRRISSSVEQNRKNASRKNSRSLRRESDIPRMKQSQSDTTSSGRLNTLARDIEFDNSNINLALEEVLSAEEDTKLKDSANKKQIKNKGKFS